MTVDVILPCLDEADALPARHRQPARGVPRHRRRQRFDRRIRRRRPRPRRDRRHRTGQGLRLGLCRRRRRRDRRVRRLLRRRRSMGPRRAARPRRTRRRRADRPRLGRRVPTTRGAWAPHARFANRVLAVLMRRATGYRLRDLGPMRVMRRADLVALDLQDPPQRLPARDGPGRTRGRLAGRRVRHRLRPARR